MLQLRLSAKGDPSRIADALGELPGIKRLARADGVRPDETILVADVHRQAADVVLDTLAELGVADEDFVLLRSEVVAPSVTHDHEGFGGGLESFSWLEVVGEARANSRPLARYLHRMAVAGVIAAIGVITKNPILIVGGMAVSPDLLPISATCVGIVLRRGLLAVRSVATLVLGLALLSLVAIAIGAVVVALDFVGNDYKVGDGGMRTLATLHYSTIVVALAAGVVAMVSFETRAAAAVGVAISVTTVPAAAYFGVAIGVGQTNSAREALATLAANVVILLVVGSLTLIVQRRLTARFRLP
jgi:uncharacterized hydrophobic protein (TIGR00271 family)